MIYSPSEATINLHRTSVFALLFIVVCVTARPALAQVDLSGSWVPHRTHEDEQDRGPGPDLGDYLGIPINEAARLFADSWDASRLTLQEHQCRVHVAPYIYHGPLNLRIWEEKDPQTAVQIIAHDNVLSRMNQLPSTAWPTETFIEFYFNGEPVETVYRSLASGATRATSR
jgi:hypothetical protein